jgi:transcription elongation GreA/GreB family factor
MSPAWDIFLNRGVIRMRLSLSHRARVKQRTDMSRAFVKEAHQTVEELPERPISSHPNFVTAEGLARIEDDLARLQQQHAAAKAANDGAVVTRIARDLRYWTSRRATAQVIAPPANPIQVQFGCTVTILRDDGRKQTYRIVGEDEADPSRGTISYVSPVARALIDKKLGDVVRAGTSDAEVVEIR